MTESTDHSGKAHQEKLFEQLAELPDEASRREFLSRNPGLIKAEIVTELTDQAREQDPSRCAARVEPGRDCADCRSRSGQ